MTHEGKIAPRGIDRISFCVPFLCILPGGETKISDAHLRGNVQFYGSRPTPYMSRLAKPSRDAKRGCKPGNRPISTASLRSSYSSAISLSLSFFFLIHACCKMSPEQNRF